MTLTIFDPLTGKTALGADALLAGNPRRWSGANDAQPSRPTSHSAMGRSDGAQWGQWLQEYRVELNEMAAPQFVAWLDGEMAKHDGGKVIPPEEVAVERYTETLEQAVRAPP